MKTIGTRTKSSDKPFLAARVPASLNDALEAHTKSTGESKTDALINALAAYLGWSEDNVTKSSSSDRLSLLEERVRKLEEVTYKPRQINLLDIKPSEPEPVNTVIISDNAEDNNLVIISDNAEDNSLVIEPNKPEPVEAVIEIDNEMDNEEEAEEWLTTKEAFERYGKGVSYNTFRNTKPEKMPEKFGLEADPSRKIPGQYSSKWLKTV